jgi:hypothetical protein
VARMKHTLTLTFIDYESDDDLKAVFPITDQEYEAILRNDGNDWSILRKYRQQTKFDQFELTSYTLDDNTKNVILFYCD